MYNEPQKNAYIKDTLDSTRNSKPLQHARELVLFFDRLAIIEENLAKDFAYFTYKEMITTLPIVVTKSIKYQRTTIANLRTYLRWAIDEGRSLDAENRLIGIVPDDLDYAASYSMCMLKDEEHLSDTLNDAFRDFDLDSVDSVYRAMVHLIFNGVQFTDVFYIREDEMNWDSSTITSERGTYVVSDKTRDMLKHVSMLLEFPHQFNSHPLCDDGMLLRTGSDNIIKRIDTATSRCSACFSKLKNKDRLLTLSFTSVWKSGVFYRAYLNELETGEVRLKQLDDTDDHLLEYQGWKKTFYP